MQKINYFLYLSLFNCLHMLEFLWPNGIIRKNLSSEDLKFIHPYLLHIFKIRVIKIEYGKQRKINIRGRRDT